MKDSARRIGVGSALLAAAVDLAEQWLAVSRIDLSVYSDNHTAIGLYEKFSFNARAPCTAMRFETAATSMSM